ncbi:MAG: hypothetical protein LBT23_01185 [Synergistaceae bacterium]|jgi:hypothetical protein|nr:hypothetical protein [Synergistaceae bacterium]
MFNWSKKNEEMKAREEIAMLEAAGCTSMADEIRIHMGFPLVNRDVRGVKEHPKKSYMIPQKST